jgi:proline dehydrogenase
MARLRRSLLFRLAMSDRFEATVRRGLRGEEVAWRAGHRYVAARDEAGAFAVARDLASRGFATSVDLFGEHVHDPAEAEAVVDAYVGLAGRLGTLPGSAWLALDLSHVGVDLGRDACVDALARICAALPAGRRLQIGAEDAARCDAILDVVLTAHARGLPLTCTLQANLRRSAGDAPRVAAAGIPVRLVKGAYVEPASIAYPYGPETDVAYIRLARDLAASGAEVLLATHDAVLREALATDLPDAAVEVLLGVRPDEANALVAAGRDVRVYLPYGQQWFRYAMRRLAEAQGS